MGGTHGGPNWPWRSCKLGSLFAFGALGETYHEFRPTHHSTSHCFLIRGTVGTPPTFSSGANCSPPKETLMSRLPIYASALVCGLAATVACSAPAAAGAHPIGVSLDCGARWDFCMQACDYSVPGGPVLGQCNDYCSTGANVCEAS